MTNEELLTTGSAEELPFSLFAKPPRASPIVLHK
ncbi:hypothetical protein C5167_000544 [Papaver somniferum]|uniref:Uncharacterized protein n=1 Tax=Papaver somniferum TaxID=3469 RepID=A0A4Y7KWZ7_PAPSO|nr:hypothetical protein C5167_000544 [Papaver somniferum]